MPAPSLVDQITVFAEHARAERQRWETACDRLNKRMGTWDGNDFSTLGAARRAGEFGVSHGTNLREEVRDALYAAALAGEAESPGLRAAVPVLEQGRTDWQAVKTTAAGQITAAGPVAAVYGL